MLATERLLEIKHRFGGIIDRIAPLDLDGQTLRLILYLNDGTNLRLTEQWDGDRLERYSYYWLTDVNELKIGWDNAPHHTRLETFPPAHLLLTRSLWPSFRALTPGRYLRRWCRRLTEEGFSHEDALIISYASFGFDEMEKTFGVETVLTRAAP